MRKALAPVLRSVAAFVFALVVAAGVIAATGGEPVPALAAMAQGAFGDTNGLLRSLAKATPLLFSALAVAVGLKAGLFNIGVEGQLLIGGITAAWAGYAIPHLPIWIHLPLALACGAAAGAAWAFVPGALRAWRGSHEVIVTIMMNYVAIQLTHLLVNGPMKDPNTMASATPYVLPSAQLWKLEGGTNFSAGILLALLAALAVHILLSRTALGLEIRAVGQNPRAARFTGIPVARTMATAMTISGALAGLAGAVEVLAVHRRFLDAFSPGYGFDSIAVALLGRLHPLGITLSALLFGGLSGGSIYMESWTDTPRQIAGIVQAVVIVAVAAQYVRKRKARKQPVAGAVQ